MAEDKELVAGLTEQHVAIISCILYFYEQHLWRFAVPSVKRTRQISEAQFLMVKLQLLSIEKIGMLTDSEVQCINAAIVIFTRQAKERVVQSESRDKVIEGCEELREYIMNRLETH